MLNLSVTGHYRVQREPFSKCQSFLLVVNDNTPDNWVTGYLQEVYKCMESGRVIIVKQGSRLSISSFVKSFVFRMAPLHHHFELNGWPEPRVIVRFWIITVVLVGLATLKVR